MSEQPAIIREKLRWLREFMLKPDRDRLIDETLQSIDNLERDLQNSQEMHNNCLNALNEYETWAYRMPDPAFKEAFAEWLAERPLPPIALAGNPSEPPCYPPPRLPGEGSSPETNR